MKVFRVLISTNVVIEDNGVAVGTLKYNDVSDIEAEDIDDCKAKLVRFINDKRE